MLGYVLAILLASPAAAQFSEGMTVEDMADYMRVNEALFKMKEGALKRAGILPPTASAAAEIAHVAEVAEAVREKRTPKAPPADERQGFGGKGQRALDQLAGSPGAKNVRPGDVEGVALNAKRGPTDEELMALRIERILDQKVHAAAAREAVKRLLWAAYRSQPGAGGTPEAAGLFAFLKKQLQPDVEGADLWDVHWQGDMPPNILATYSGVIRVGPSFSALGVLGQVTTMFHEMLHGHDDGGDKTSIEVNRMTGKYDYSPSHPVPAMHNAAEMLAYTDMARWMTAF